MPQQSSSPRRKICHAMTTTGAECRRPAEPGLTVCLSHGGGTATSVRKSSRAKAQAEAHTLWGIAPHTGSISVEEQLTRLAQNKLADVNALRIKISADPIRMHIGRLTETITLIEYDIEGTVQSKSGTQETRVKRSGTSVWVAELHKCEVELLNILRLLADVTGSTEEVDLRRVRSQTAREAARLAKAYPGMSADAIAAELVKKAG